VKLVSCNSWLRALNASAGWLHEEGVRHESHLPRRLVEVVGRSAMRILVRCSSPSQAVRLLVDEDRIPITVARARSLRVARR
jgi:hypothetical protein